MTAGISLILRKAGAHRAPLQPFDSSFSAACEEGNYFFRIGSSVFMTMFVTST